MLENMKPWQIILPASANGFFNMAFDESVFNACADGQLIPPIFRLYTWETPCITIGYFQKYGDFAQRGVPVIRRMTGGLSVYHQDDLSYSFVADERWPHLRDQERTYREIHEGIRRGLSAMGVETQFYASDNASPAKNGGVCVETLYPCDVLSGGKKIVGSCQRRRGGFLFVQGSIHIGGLSLNLSNAATAVVRGWEQSLGVAIEPVMLEGQLADSIRTLEKKYRSDEWNRKR